MFVQLIHNPASGTHDDDRLSILSRAFEACGASVVAGQTSINGMIRFATHVDLVCVSGGDGALRQVVAEMARQNIRQPVCVFPAGTVNLIARELGYSSQAEQFAQEVMTGFLNGARLKDPLAMTDHGPLVACLSAGPEGLAVARHRPSLKKRIGGLAYAVSALGLLASWPRSTFHLHIDQQRLICEAFYVVKGHFFAGDWTLVPQARLGMNHFHLLSLNRLTRWNYLRFLLKVAMNKDPESLDFVQLQSISSFRIESPTGAAQLAFQVDGDSMPDAPEEVRISEFSVEYCLPQAG
ncbi:diacylglycerol/lipid kinase family protein [Parasphingorhabdus sp.]|jgi:diacylglycerol kinase family enzyme|uniref:diacylglycerol/lipid kinase family protein n=1 Tax=Parasphingorhabdus sp. TaxID=2709688 RepID=UPI003D2CD421